MQSRPTDAMNYYDLTRIDNALHFPMRVSAIFHDLRYDYRSVTSG